MKSRTRIALYSHDTLGLGHIRRNLLIARALAASELDPAILLVAGNGRANSFSVPPGVDSITLPALQKDAEGRYAAGALPVSLQRLVNLRARTIRAALESFDPDLLIVDKVPCGVLGELMPALAALTARGRARCVLGLRDVLDEPEVVRREWDEAQNDRAIRDHYSAIWVYGDQRVYDIGREYAFSPEVRARITYTGYLDQTLRIEGADTRAASASAQKDLPPGPLVLCTVGGGQDGGSVAHAFADSRLPDDVNGVVLTGPFMPRRTLCHMRRVVRTKDRLFLLEFVPEATRLVRRADRVVTMGGYNTVSEVLSFGKPALVIPRVSPRREQLIRAERLHQLGLVDVLHPSELSADAISEWLLRDRMPPAVRAAVDLDGLSRVPILARQLLETAQVRALSFVN